ncbi:hypothetical protein UAY_02194 [Enterococcus moraviensis ATCC BAA-383]|uniref:DUF421 domain-containing protein n=2 Tax=Enterococcus moraviensis TaxID=155617 RepID=R2SUL4_9ENTE|nr:hypothetical protein UAY_02194 [Enterococcus moraviensis ATCC BAA-383]EOT71900.1 hypothetical protein I586_01707 [Enterococcus moraviensis ATCC BAA-383]OJG68018.1 hypothetical protein RV09_GL002129 [Enterococcus moraviensis]
MFPYFDVGLKLTIGLLCLIIFINISGKGNLAPKSAADQIQNYVLGGIIGGVIYNSQITVLQFLIVLLIWGTLVTVLRIAKLRNPEIKKIVDGQPIILIDKGQMIPENFKQANLSAHDFGTMLRLHDINTITEVKRVQLEQNGDLTIVRKGDPNRGLYLITDGLIIEDALEDINKDKNWLMEELAKQNYTEASTIFVAEYFQGTLRIVPYK